MLAVYLPDVPFRIPGVKSSRYSRYQRTSDLRWSLNLILTRKLVDLKMEGVPCQHLEWRIWDDECVDHVYLNYELLWYWQNIGYALDSDAPTCGHRLLDDIYVVSDDIFSRTVASQHFTTGEIHDHWRNDLAGPRCLFMCVPFDEHDPDAEATRWFTCSSSHAQ